VGTIRLTYHTQDVDSDRDRPATDEIEIPETAIMAARRVMEKYYIGDGQYDLSPPCLAEVAQAVILEMRARRLLSLRNDPVI
jgi:hypothetical protein